MKSVLTTIPLYTMQTVQLPTRICSQIDRIARDFLWGSTNNNRTWHLVNWETITRPNVEGGLAISRAQDRNIGLLAKQCWQIIHETNRLWVQVFQTKYLKEQAIVEVSSKNYKKPSSTWRALLLGAKALSEGIMWRLGDGKTMRLWMDKWCPMRVLQTHALHHPNAEQLELKVADYCTIMAGM